MHKVIPWAFNPKRGLRDVLNKTDVAKLRLNLGRYMANQAAYIVEEDNIKMTIVQ
jgi:hypothetical protein